ncbi:hypothetical protein F9802_09895 [Bacillus aerolatus]|uniref:Uncharacterized protein n=1 Tax=Bacillus aerolatus TaxID=2653354 RepID=A0A6I1FEX8_9BACI|nr:hypothetical protein [Bacillus aerolatus]KAB7706506.1 hypothetical protein F9802_09895 [Bacillus aerolatus]
MSEEGERISVQKTIRKTDFVPHEEAYFQSIAALVHDHINGQAGHSRLFFFPNFPHNLSIDSFLLINIRKLLPI